MIHIKNLVCVCVVVFTVTSSIAPLYGAFEYMGVGWPAATANIKVLGHHPQHFTLNPSLMDNNLASQVILSYQKPFQSLDLQAGTATLQSSYRSRPYIYSLDYFGDAHYSELKIISGSRWYLEKDYSVGVSLNYHHLSFSGLDPRHAITLSLSSLAIISDQLKVGSVMEHVIQWGSGVSLPQKFHMGGEYVVGPATLFFAIEKESALPLETCLGLLLSNKSFWQIGIGYRDLSEMVSAGWRIHTGKIALHYVCAIHPHLPVSHGFGLEFVLP